MIEPKTQQKEKKRFCIPKSALRVREPLAALQGLRLSDESRYALGSLSKGEGGSATERDYR
jgi:hypothetical protein